MLYMPDILNKNIETIYLTILEGFLKDSSNFSDLKKSCKKIFTTTIVLFKSVLSEFVITPSKCHYTFNIRDIAKIF